MPERLDLARWLTHAAQDQLPLTGLSDHYVSEAIYLRDPDHHGIEIYWDRPRSLWEGEVAQRLTTEPLDVQDLVRDVDRPAGLPSGTVMGHVHLRVASIPETNAFYRDVLGFDVMASMGQQATFLSAGGYHHHLGANTWGGATARARRRTTARCGARDDPTAHSPGGTGAGRGARRAAPTLRDPSGNPVLGSQLRVAPQGRARRPPGPCRRRGRRG